MDWNLLAQRFDAAVLSLQSAPEFSRALVTTKGTTLMPDSGDNMFFSDFRCGNGDATVAHFTANLIDQAGFGHYEALKKTLPDCAEVYAFRRPSGTISVYTRLN